MADISKSGTPSLTTPVPSFEHRLAGLLAGEALGAGDACYIKSDGKVYKSLATTTATDATNAVDGYAPAAVAIGGPITLMWGLNFRYGASLTPGTFYYLSGATAGALATTATSGQPNPIARSVDTGRVFLSKSY